MNYLVTGATGFIGRPLVEELLRRGHSVNYLARRRSQDLDSRAAFHLWNPAEDLSLSSVPRLDAIIHLAGEPVAQRWTEEVKRRIYESRVQGTGQLVAAVGRLQHRPSVLVSASAIGYYGDRGGDILTEASSAGTGFLADLCVHWEREALQACEHGIRVVPLRISAVLGTGGGALKKMVPPFRMGLGGRLGSGRQWMSWIHLRDMVRLLIFAAENESVSGPMNGSSPGPVTNAEFTKTLARQLHRSAVFPAPKFALRIVLGEMVDFLFSSERVIPEAAQRAGFSFEHPSLEGALRNVLGR
jgi:uncharacterized protein